MMMTTGTQNLFPLDSVRSGLVVGAVGWGGEVGPAWVSRSTGSPDILLSVKALASLYTGFRSAAILADWGLLEGDGIALADRIFSSPHLPHCSDHF